MAPRRLSIFFEKSALSILLLASDKMRSHDQNLKAAHTVVKNCGKICVVASGRDCDKLGAVELWHLLLQNV
jgi:hypothetical protein